jgi:hypothetical protein
VILRSRLIVAGLALALLAGAIHAVPQVAPRAEIDEATIRDGDVLLFKSWTWRSIFMRVAQPGSSGYGHAGIAYRDEYGRLSVLHADPRIRAPLDRDGMRSDVVAELIDHYGITEVAVLRPDDARLAGDAVSGALGILQRGVGFDHGFDMQDRSTIYCTELLVEIFPEAWFDEVLATSPYLMPDDLMQVPGFRTVATGA